jgi:hypothetical protein
MSQIFYSEIDKNLQKELDARARAGVVDRSEKALRYMTEKVANVSLTAYEGNKRDKTKIVHELGGRTVTTGEYLPGGDNGYLTERVYTLGESRWVANGFDGGETQWYPAYNQKTFIVDSSEQEFKTETKTNKSYRIPPFITQASLQINDNSKGTTNKATISITIPNADRDLNFMESVYARPGRYCLVRIEHPESALMTRDVDKVNGMLLPSSLPARQLIKERYPEAESEYDEIRKMNKLQFEGVITSFEYSYNQDGTVTMTVYILGTSQTYTDLSMIMQTATTGSISGSNSETVDKASSFYEEIYKEIKSVYDISTGSFAPGETLPTPYEAFGVGINEGGNNDSYWLWNFKSLSGKYVNYINLNYLINLINRKILSKLKDVVNTPRIYSDTSYDCYSNFYDHLKSADPDNILLVSPGEGNEFSTDGYGLLFMIDDPETPFDAKYWLPELIANNNTSVAAFYDPNDPDAPDNRKEFGRTGRIFINLETIKGITTKLGAKTDEFTVGNFLKQISEKISDATSGAITLKLITDPEDLTLLYYRDTNWIKDGSSPQPYLLPMFASDPRGSVVREFKLSAKLPSNVQSLMYSINSTDKVTESQLGPYISFMYNNGTATRTPQTITVNGKQVVVDEMTQYGGGKELTERLTREYAAAHDKYVTELQRAAAEYGNNPTSENKRLALKSALTKYLQYPFRSIQQTNQVAAPTFPIEAEFTIDGVNGLRYGDILDFPGLPAKYRTNTTFTIKGITHNVSTTGEWTTQVSCLMRPKFD